MGMSEFLLPVAGFRSHYQGDLMACGQWQFKPARAVGISGRDLSARLLDRMRDLLAPFRFRMVGAGVCINSKLPFFGRSKSETNELSSTGGFVQWFAMS